ncbi:MAG: hypothetical protein KBT06_05215 [Prevotellaceae bacterium]|nr:hypothetical protein [Candidatus Colivivens equi]
MQISTNDWKNYIDRLSKLNQKAASEMQKYVAANGFADTDALIDFCYAMVTKYGEGSAELACQMYDAMAEMANAAVDAAVPAATATYAETARAVQGSLLQSPTGQKLPQIANRLVKQAAADTTVQNALRDRAEWAWIPSGSETCGFCITLASNGWQKASRNMLKGNHATHIHANCDCMFAIRFSKNDSVKGYEPDYYKKLYDEASGGSSSEKVKALRRQLEDRDKINAQKRAAYAKRNENESIITRNRAKRINSIEDLRKISNSAIIDMQNHDEIKEYFAQKGIIIEGFEKKDLFEVKAVFAGVDDGIELMPEAEKMIKSITYNPKQKAMGKMSSNGKMQIGKSGLKDYGTGVHETAHAFDFVMSDTNSSFSDLIIENARKSLKLRSNSREYLNLRVSICGDIAEAKKNYEVFAYAVETELGGVENKLAKAIVNELRK